MTRRSLPLLAALLALAAPAVVSAQPTPTAERLAGTWRVGGQEIELDFRRQPDGSFSAEPGRVGGWWRPERRLTLTRRVDGAYEIVVERRAPERRGAAGALRGQRVTGWIWQPEETVLLRQEGGVLRDLAGRELEVDVAPETPAQPPASAEAPAAEAPDARARPVVRVLITGFDRFPRPWNHPRWINDSRPPEQRDPGINPSGWVTRHFELTDLCPELRDEVEVQLFKLTDVPVYYVLGAQRICEEILRVDADVVISMGVGADGGADADVETTCENLMDDMGDAMLEERGPFQLPAEWPPAGDRSTWSQADREWLWRYPDNAGVSYNRHPIDPAAPATLRSLLPVAKIVKRVKRAGLRAIDGGGGPGRYICNNVMFKVIQTQSARGKVGGFIHLPSWRESRQDSYKQVVACAIEESARAYLALRAASQDEGLPAPALPTTVAASAER